MFPGMEINSGHENQNKSGSVLVDRFRFKDRFGNRYNFHSGNKIGGSWKAFNRAG